MTLGINLSTGASLQFLYLWQAIKDVWSRSGVTWSGDGITPEWKGVDNKSGGITLASAYALCLDLLSCVWLRISGGRNYYQEFQRGIV